MARFETLSEATFRTPRAPPRGYSPCIGCTDREHVARWTGAMTAAKANRPELRCTSLTRAGKPCGFVRMRGSTRCRHHLNGRERDAIDAQREHRVRRALNHGRFRLKPAKVTSALASIARRRLRRIWAIDPTIPGTTLVLGAHDEQRVLEWLAELHRIDVENDPTLTPRAIDKFRWSAMLALSGAISPATAAHRINVAMREQHRWRERQARMTAHDTEPSAKPIPR